MKNTTTHDFDVTIIGGGPAGTAAALTLLNYSSLKVALIENTDYSNLRIGETVSPSLLPLLRYLGLEKEFLKDGHMPFYGIDAAWGSSRLFSIDFLFTGQGDGWHLDRSKFDYMMAKKVSKKGGHLITATRILTQKQTEKKWEMTTFAKNDKKNKMVSAFVIDATGKRATFARKLGTKWKIHDNLIGVVGFYQSRIHQDNHHSMFIESVSDGWWYSSPLPNDRSIVVFMTDSDICKSIQVKTNWDLLLTKTKYIKEALRGELITPLKIYSAHSSVIRQTHFTNWIPAGEASASFDPLSSLGIGYAITSGIHAAKVAHEQLVYGRNVISNYLNNIIENFSRYLDRRKYYYQLEKRWKDRLFWKRRLESN